MNKKGVTLMELVIVMAIIAIGAVLMAPNIGAWLPQYRLKTATRDIASTMRLAQMKAVSSNTQYRVNLDPAQVGDKNYVLQRDSGGVFVSEGAVQRLPDGISVFNNSFNDPDAVALFRPNATSNGGTLILQNLRGAQKTITVLFTTGRISVQ